ncbi:HNH endonuclease signature motif containing protein [uncultured Aeromicrobium sp.]|uniref:HNH endonuclease signature motif containing protein n=1 Tax=uncultured Aeromicrobium sp. TaxID=337820 RepID=UPI0025F15DED|nr:HNH endonuclease signature motif containing protein [uncultured Aeromicrobium sp.]
MVGGTSDDRLTVMGVLQAERARAEYRVWAAMLEFLDAERVRIERDVEPRLRELETAAVRSVIAQANGWSEDQAASRIHEAETARDDLPTVWKAFGDGEIDAARVSVIAAGAWKLTKQRSIGRLDARAVAYAATHTVGELRRWIKRFIAQVEPDEVEKRYEDIVAERRVTIHHDEDGTGSLYAENLPSYVLAGIDQRLDYAAKSLTDDDRTIAQRRADLFVDALDHIDPENEPARVPNLAIGVMVPASTLAGVDDQPAISADRDWFIPAHVLRTLAVSGDPFWYRLTVDDHDDVLATTYEGRYPSDHLRNAIRFRDGTCRYPGCMKKAQNCDLDHRQPLPDGPTNGENLWALCRHHHKLKTFNHATPIPRDDDWAWNINGAILTE